MANGSPDFGIIAGGVKGITDQDAPIRLQRGDLTFGAHHIADKHGHWLKAKKRTAPELVWQKCRNSGQIYGAGEPGRGKIWMPIYPAALMVLNYVDAQNFWTVISLYFREGKLDGEIVGRYTDVMAPPAAVPVFSIQPLPPPPQIIIKKRRSLP